MNPEVFGCFSRFFLIFSIFGWFWKDFTINFDSLAWFPARGWFRITLALNFQARRKFQIGRNKGVKNSWKFQLWANDVFIIPPSSRALALHALIISPKPSAKIVKLQNERTEIPNIRKFGSKIFKLSFNLKLKTSCPLPPYYSLELKQNSSTSQYYLPGSRI